MFRISLLAFGFLVCFLAVSAEESQDQDLSNIVSDLASLRRDVRSPGASTKKKSKKGEKKARRKKKKGPSSKRRTAKNNSKRPKKKSGSNQNRRKNNGKKNIQRKRKSKKPKSKRKIKKKPQKIKIAKKNDKRRTKPRKCNRQTGADDGTCSANIETAMDYEGKQIKNFNNQKKRIEDFDKLMKNKGGKKENFQNTTTYMKEALGSDNSCNGTTNETDAQTAVSTHTTLSNCSTSVDAGCSIPSSTYNTTELTSCETSFATVTTKNAECYKLTTATSPDLSAACTCWAAAATLVETTKALKCSAVTPYQSMTALKKTCLSKFSECKKAEDASVGLIQVCNGRTTPSTASVPSPAPAPAPAAPSPAASPSTAAPVSTPSAAPVTTTAAAAPTPSTAAASPTTTTAAAAPTTTAAGLRSAVCQFQGLGAGNVTGVVLISQKSGAASATFQLNLAGLTAGKHGFHVHANGDLSQDCKGAGGHFNPYNKTHGDSSASERHVGDRGNVLADTSGNVVMEIVDTLATLVGDVDITGKAMVIHEGVDDLGLGGDSGSLATGNAGGRAGCCLIEAA